MATMPPIRKVDPAFFLKRIALGKYFVSKYIAAKCIDSIL